MNEAMLPYFQVQLCIADAGMAGQLLHIFQPDIVLIFKPVKQGRCDGVKYIIKRECEPSDCGSWQHV